MQSAASVSTNHRDYWPEPAARIIWTRVITRSRIRSCKLSSLLEEFVKSTWSAKRLTPAAVLAMAVSACSGGGTSIPNTTAPPPSASKNQINAMPREKLQDGGTFTWSLTQMPSNFNYNELDGTLLDNSYVMGALTPTV